MSPVVETLYKSAVSFLAVLVYARILGKQQMSQMTFYDYITGITIGSIAASITVEPKSQMWLLVLALTVFVFLDYISGVITERSRPLRKIVEGEPTILIHNGKIMEHNMRKARYNMENLMMQLREKDVFNIDDVDFAILETDGRLTVLKKPSKRMLTPQDLGIATSYEGLSSELIVDGEIIYQNLMQNNLDEEWLITQLKARGYNSPANITYASLDPQGNLYIDERSDKLRHITDITD
ncbi:MAG: YetF domain-containing protein [Syntrophomonadaceae bacterium]|jgi:uncharacterized membrane protein YcaP (DUF421 family)